MSITLSCRFQALSEQLHQHAAYWRAIAFHSPLLPWMDQHPRLRQRLLALSEEEVEHLGRDTPALVQWLATELPFAHALHQLCELPMLQQRSRPPVPPRFYAGIPGRKWQQVEAFAHCLPAASGPLLEWCAGKSHLGFYLQHCQQQTVTALEWDANLVAQANARAADQQIPLRSHRVDVLSAEAEHFLQPQPQAVALHACGELHEQLLRLTVQHSLQQIHLAPCCYHKRAGENYQPLSQAGRNMPLPLNKQELHTAVMETATAGATVQRQRKRLQAMRLGFDALQRDVRGCDEFLPLPSLPAHWARAPFEEFCRHCAARRALVLPDDVNWNRYLQQGQQRLREVSAFDLVRFLFRRPLELWLALDRALFLQEQGYKVVLGQFCDAQVTPRNLLIQGWFGSGGQ